jgi:hypothetical protein
LVVVRLRQREGVPDGDVALSVTLLVAPAEKACERVAW